MKYIYVVLLLVCQIIIFAGISKAQSSPNDPFQFEYTYATPSEGEFQDDVDIHEGKTQVLVPLSDRKTDGFGFTLGGAFQINSWRTDSNRADGIDLYKLKMPATADFDITKNAFLTLNITPGIHSDFEKVNSDDWRVEGSAAGTFISSRTLQFSLGAAYSEDFGDPQLFPVGGVRWQASDRLLLNIMIPRPSAYYELVKGFRVFVFGEPSGGEWNVGDSSDVQVDVQQKGYRTGAGLDLSVGEKTWLYFAGGVETNREIQLAVGDKEVFNDDVELDDTAFVRIGVRVSR
jgi:hypothetical protein